MLRGRRQISRMRRSLNLLKGSQAYSTDNGFTKKKKKKSFSGGPRSVNQIIIFNLTCIWPKGMNKITKKWFGRNKNISRIRNIGQFRKFTESMDNSVLKLLKSDQRIIRRIYIFKSSYLQNQLFTCSHPKKILKYYLQ